MSEVALPGPLCIVLRAQLAKRGARGQQVVDEARELVGGGADDRVGALASPHPPVVGAPALVAATAGLRRAPKGLAGAIAGLPRAPASGLPAGELMAGAKPSQEPKAFALGHFRGARPLSARRVGTGLACKPGMATRSTPVSCYRTPRASSSGAFLVWVRRWCARLRGASASGHTGLIA
jgi:hypothetical protein